MSPLWKESGRTCSHFKRVTSLRAKYHPSLTPQMHLSDEQHRSLSTPELPVGVPRVNAPRLSQNDYSLQVICYCLSRRKSQTLTVSY